MENEKIIRKFNKQALKDDKKRKLQSNNKWRKKIFKSVNGKTLEVAVGAGMNYAFFPPSIEYTGVDFSPVMLEKAKKAVRNYHFKADFILSNVEELSFSENTFDTIVSSGTLCGYENPVETLNLFNSWCKNDGQILLLEHGVFENKILKGLQRVIDPFAHKVIGCHQNRDIYDLVNQSELEIVTCERGIFGSLYLIWAKSTE